MCRKHGIECTDKWYDHQPLPVAEKGEVRITWDTTVYTDKVLKHNRPDITLVHKDAQKWTRFDIAVPADQNIIRTEEKVKRPSIRNQKNLLSLKSDSDTHRDWFSWNHFKERNSKTTLSAILGTAHVLGKVLCP